MLYHLDAVKLHYRENPDECFQEVLKVWLKRDKPKPTLIALANALGSKTVGFGHLVSEVEQLHIQPYILVTDRNDQCATNSTNEATAQELIHSKLAKQSSKEENSKEKGIPKVVFTCTCGGQCSLKSYMIKGCPRTPSLPYPYLHYKTLLKDVKQKENLIQRLSNDVKEIQICFAELFEKVCESLKSKVKPKDLAVRAISRMPNMSKPDRKELMQSKKIKDCFEILRDYMSFFNYELLEHIINWKKCPKECKECWEKYHKRLSEFCKRKVFEVPPDAYSVMNVSSTEQTKFVVLSTRDMVESDLESVWEARMRIANLLDIDVGDLHLHRIDQGSLILVFSTPNILAERLFPLDNELRDKLKAKGYTIITDTGNIYISTRYYQCCYINYKE